MCGTRPSAPHDQRTASTYIFGSICPAEGKAAGLVLPPLAFHQLRCWNLVWGLRCQLFIVMLRMLVCWLIRGLSPVIDMLPLGRITSYPVGSL